MGLIDVMLNNYDKNLRKRLAKNRELVKEAKKKNRKASIAYTKALEEIEGLKHGIVYEYCSNCESEVGIAWDCENDGLYGLLPKLRRNPDVVQRMQGHLRLGLWNGHL